MGTLTLRKKKAKTLTLEKEIIEVERKSSKRKRLKALLANFDIWRNRMPLKIGIRDDFLIRFGDEFSRKAVRAVLRLHTIKSSYIENVATGGKRFNLEGVSDSSVSEHDRKQALEILSVRNKTS
jgi:sRNA-binding protein